MPLTLDEYLGKFGKLLARQAERNMRPLHRPTEDPAIFPVLLRRPFEAQAHVIAAGAKALKRQKALLVIGEMGVGKTLIGQGIIHSHANKKPYRALVMCPGQLVNKWEREIRETIPGVDVVQLGGWKDVVKLERGPIGKPTWFIIARDRAKLGSKWRAAFVQRKGEKFLRCPKCGQILYKKRTEEGEGGELLSEEALGKRQFSCSAMVSNGEVGKLVTCGSALWTMTHELKRFEPAKYIHKQLRGFFDYAIFDEAHEEKSANSAQGNALGSLAASAKKVLALTGTLIGGYAEHIRPLLFRLAPSSLITEGFQWGSATAFNEKYGRIETRISEREGGQSDSNRQSRGKSKTTTKIVRPGIMPTLFGSHLMRNAVFLGLDEVASNLPQLQEIVQAVPMEGEMKHEYQRIEEICTKVIQEMVRRGNKRFLGAFLQTLLAYSDHPYGWEVVGYKAEGDIFVPVVIPKNLSADTVYPKEEALLEVLKEEKKLGRKCWVFSIMTNVKDVNERLHKLISKAGFRSEILRSTVELAKREEWINERAPRNDVLISHPRLVETGLDLFDKGGSYNFPTLIFFSTGYNTFTLRQASRRSWRIGQRELCKVIYLFYHETMQERAMSLMGKKLAASHAIEGKFSSDGLIALSGGEAMEMALAKSLAEQIDEGSAARAWQKIGTVDRTTGLDMHVDDFAGEMEELEAMAKLLYPELASVA